MKFYETERLIIRPTNISDAQFVFDLVNSPKWLKYIGDRNVNSLAKAQAYIEDRMLPQLEKYGYTNNTIIKKSDNIKIGSCGVYHRDGMENPDLGFALLAPYEGQGYGFESANKILKIAVKEYELHIIDAITTHANLASQKLLLKLGFNYKANINLPNDPEQLRLYNFTAKNA